MNTWSVIGPLTFSDIYIILHDVAHFFLMSFFNILDHASTTFNLKNKEAIHIQWEKPTLNHQFYHINFKLSLFCSYYCNRNSLHIWTAHHMISCSGFLRFNFVVITSRDDSRLSFLKSFKLSSSCSYFTRLFGKLKLLLD